MRLKGVVTTALIVSSMTILLGAAGPRCCHVVPPNAVICGKSLTEWTEDYWRWSLTEGGQVPYQPGPGPMAFMPIPEGEWLGGSWTPEDPGYLQGTLEVTLEPGTPFVLPQFALISELKADGSHDAVFPDDVIREVISDVSYTLDGKPIAEDLWDYYVGPKEFDPPVLYDDPSGDYVGAWAFQGNSFVWLPLSPGTHEIKLYEKMVVWPDQAPEGWGSFGVIYDNTWIVHVVCPK